MSTTVQTLLTQLAQMLQEDNSARGGTDWSSGLWTVDELIAYINAGQKQLVLDSQIMKLIAAVASVTGQRIYSDPDYTMQIDRIGFNNRATYRTTRTMLDRDNPKWRTLSGIPRQYHQDQLSTKTFEVDRAPTSAMTGSGYTAIGTYGTLRYMMHSTRQVTDGAITSATSIFTSATAAFTGSDVAKEIAIAGAGAGGSTLITTISSLNSGTSVNIGAAASTTVSGATAVFGAAGFYSATIPAGGGSGVMRYSYGAPAINGILPHGSPYAGTLRQMLTGLTNFEILATRLIDDIALTTDLLRVPDYTVLYLKYWVLKQMLEKEGEGQDLPRAKYCQKRYDMGMKLFLRLQSAMNDSVAQPTGATK